MEQIDLKATELDKMTCSYDLQMLKAALAYFPPQPKRFLSLLVKMQELKNTFRLVSASESTGFLNICSAPESEPKQGFFDILNEIKEYGSPEQQKMFDRLNQAIQLSSMYEQMSQTASENARRPEQPGATVSREQPPQNATQSGPEQRRAAAARIKPSEQEPDREEPDLAAASLSAAPPIPESVKGPDFRTCIRNSLSPENQALFDSYSAMFHVSENLSGKET